jgi:hypothetical protein
MIPQVVEVNLVFSKTSGANPPGQARGQCALQTCPNVATILVETCLISDRDFALAYKGEAWIDKRSLYASPDDAIVLE